MGFATKAEWADARAKELEDQLYRVSSEHVEYRQVRRKYSSMENIRQEAAKFRRMAATFRRRGL